VIIDNAKYRAFVDDYPPLTQLNQYQGRSSIGTAEEDEALQLRNSKQAMQSMH
jgi:hypothetical protein